MKKYFSHLLILTVLLSAGCSSDKTPGEEGHGTLEIRSAVDATLLSASSSDESSGSLTVPDANDFELTITGASGSQSWNSLAEYTQDKPVFKMGDYTVEIANGDPDAEGLDVPYYHTAQTVTVLPRREVSVDLTATIANSQVVVRATPQFLKYFHEAKFTVTTASSNTFDFTPGATPEDEPIFVKGGTALTINGSARRQSPTDTAEGPLVTFAEQNLAATTPRTCHVITYDAKDAGSATLTITFEDDYTEIRPVGCEVNEGAIDDIK